MHVYNLARNKYSTRTCFVRYDTHQTLYLDEIPSDRRCLYAHSALNIKTHGLVLGTAYHYISLMSQYSNFYAISFLYILESLRCKHSTCEGGNETLVSIKCKEFLDELRTE
jgi:hypothetical protein